MEDQISSPISAFTDVGISNIELGAELYTSMRVSFEDLTLGGAKDKMKEIAGFAGEFEDSLPLIRSAMSKKPLDVNAVDHIYSFVLLQRQRMETKNKLRHIEDEISLYE
jgi:hypothetical protein